MKTKYLKHAIHRKPKPAVGLYEVILFAIVLLILVALIGYDLLKPDKEVREFDYDDIRCIEHYGRY